MIFLFCMMEIPRLIICVYIASAPWLGFKPLFHFHMLFTGGHRTRVSAVTLDNMAEGVFAQREDLPQFCGVNHRFSLYFWLHQVDLKPFFCYASWEQRKESLYIEISRFWFHRETRVASFCNEGVNRCLSPRTRVPPLMNGCAADIMAWQYTH